MCQGAVGVCSGDVFEVGVEVRDLDDMGCEMDADFCDCRYLMVTDEGTGRLVGVIIKKRLVGYLEHLREHEEGDE